MSREIRTILFAILIYLPVPAAAQHTAPTPKKSRNEAAIDRLYQLHFWTDDNYSLKSDANRQAIIAFQKLNGLPRTGRLTDSTIARMGTASVPSPHVRMHKAHLEVDLNHQLLFVVDSNDVVNRILPVSTGNGQLFDYPEKGPEYARTPRGMFKVFYKVSGWKKSALGLMFDPMYFNGGFALHGSNEVPAKPASHGCIRMPMFAAREMFRVIPVGMPVIVFGENPKPR